MLSQIFSIKGGHAIEGREVTYDRKWSFFGFTDKENYIDKLVSDSQSFLSGQ